ncbi:EAL domain-containing protein [Sulfurospirillum sp. 1307]|jgi:diguanylate cyclase (GGDEF)-like protein
MAHFNDYSIKTKLVIVFIVFKILPLLLLAAIGLFSFLEIDKLLHKSSSQIITKSTKSIKNTTDLTIQDSIKALDRKSQEMLENKTYEIANKVAEFLKQRDQDILFLSKQTINPTVLKNFYDRKSREIYVPISYHYDERLDKWLPNETTKEKTKKEFAILKDNKREFHKVVLKKINKKSIPIYKEITYFDVNGEEIYKISSIDKKLKNISIKQNTYCKAENYYEEALKLKEGEIYVSKVIGAYVPSPIIGSFTKEKTKKANIKFEPQKYAYAGAENPVGKKFEGIVRFVTPVYRDKKLQGYLTLALDHEHLMNFTDFVNPTGTMPLDISDASKGNYAFMWSADFKAISHPRDYFIVGYDPKTGEMVPGWIDLDFAKKFKKSGMKDLNKFLQKQPLFYNQSLKKKPNLEQVKIGQVGLDCRYLNFAPQCQDWKQLSEDGGYGSFIIFWSNVWKLTTAASIPYYTGDYNKSKIGFGFVTIGANVDEFHKAATKTKENVDKILVKEEKNIKKSINEITKNIFDEIKSQINKMVIATIFLIILIIYVAIYLSNNISNRIQEIIIGTKKLKEKNFDYQLEIKEKDEIGKLKAEFNEMAKSIKILTDDLQEKLYTDDLTKLKNRRAFWKDIKSYKNPILFLLDIDLFKNINDYYGVQAGNFVLIKFANILKDFSKKHNAELYRIGSDEYLLLIDKNDLNDTEENLIKQLNKIVSKEHFEDKKLQINTTISFTCGISDGEGNLLEKADLALNEAARNKVAFMKYSNSNPNMNRHKENILWKQKISYAIENDFIVPYFQEIINIKNPKEKKYEALIRLIDNDNVISPYIFLNIAKETKLYPELTKIMIEKTFKIFDKKDASFSINLSIDDILNEKTVEFIHKKLKKYNVQNKLIFELLESEEISNFEEIIPFIYEMKKLGVRFAIDDFGSGYSNFSYLLQIKPDFIKIDGSLIKNLTKTSNEYHIVGAIVKFAKLLDIDIIAEHVSSQEIVDVLGDFDIKYMQGFHFSEPIAKI